MIDICYHNSTAKNIFALVQFSCLLYESIYSSQIILLIIHYLYAFHQSKKIFLVGIMADNLEESILDGVRSDVELGRFLILNVPICQQLPGLTSLYF